MGDKMKAVFCEKYGSPEYLKLKSAIKPDPKDNEVQIQNHASAVTSSDTYIRRLNVLPLYFQLLARLFIGFRRPRNPILGMIYSGEITKIGKSVDRFKVGDTVFGSTVQKGTIKFGAYAEYNCVSENSCIAVKPDNLTFLESAAITYGGVMALWCLEKSRFPHSNRNTEKSIKVLVYGASGSVGTSLIQILNYYGAEVTAVCSLSNFGLVKSLGAANAIDYKTQDMLSVGKQWNFIYDAVGYKKSKKYLNDYKKALSAQGVFYSVDDGSPDYNYNHLDSLARLAESNIIKPAIDRIYNLEEISEAHSYVDQGHKKGNVLLAISQRALHKRKATYEP